MAFCNVQIAFAGHNRAADIGDPEGAERGLRRAFALLPAAGVQSGQLLTGMADGADRMAARSWNGLYLGPIHAVYPFLPEGHAPQALEEVQASTWLDGAGLELVKRNAHQAQTRWLVRAADVMIVLWDGGPGRGPGGTADAVRLALEAGIVVVWVKPGPDPQPRLIKPALWGGPADFIELLEHLRLGDEAIAPLVKIDDLTAILAARGFEPVPTPQHRSSKTGLDRLLGATVWKTYDFFRRTLGQGAVLNQAPVSVETPDDLLLEPGFVYLTKAYSAADKTANDLSSIHRSQQILLLAGAVLATTIGVIPSVWPSIKIYAVLCEAALALLALGVWSGAARAGRHERWSSSRRLAEQLRLERAAWALGLSSVNHTEAMGPAALAARNFRRRAGSAPGAFSADRLERWGGWAIYELVTSQAGYHRNQGHRNAMIAHRVHQVETVSFLILICGLLSYSLIYALCAMMHLELPHWIGGVVMMMSAIVPAIGAASLALEASLSFREQGERSLYQASRLEDIAASLGACPHLYDLQHAAAAAMDLHNSSEDRWGEDANRRKLVRG